VSSTAAPVRQASEAAEQKSSFTRGIFAGVVLDSLLFPYPRPLEERNPDEARTVRRLIKSLREMQDGLIDSAKFDEEETIPENVIRAFAEAGLLGLTIPRKYGGLELSSSAYARVFETLSTVDASLAVLVGVHCGLGSKAIVLHGSDEQKERYLPSLARGDFLAAYALTEPEVGSDAQNIKTTATLSKDGSHWRLNGHKIWIGNGHRAGVIATFAQAFVQRRGETVPRMTAFLIRPDMPGFKVVGTVHKLGIRGSTQAELSYDGLVVPADHLLGAVGRGFGVAVHVLNAGRLTLAAGCTGGAKRTLNEMTSYAEQRVQFGHPLADFEITQRKLSQMASEIYASEAMLGILASLVDRGGREFARQPTDGGVGELRLSGVMGEVVNDERGHQRIRLERRAYLVNWEALPGARVRWCALVVTDPGLNRSRPAEGPSRFHDADERPISRSPVQSVTQRRYRF
jgi:acyl-CoA dehydrogenase family protein 9